MIALLKLYSYWKLSLIEKLVFKGKRWFSTCCARNTKKRLSIASMRKEIEKLRTNGLNFEKKREIFSTLGRSPYFVCVCVCFFGIVVGRDRRVARLVVQGRFSARTTSWYLAWPRSQRDGVSDYLAYTTGPEYSLWVCELCGCVWVQTPTLITFEMKERKKWEIRMELNLAIWECKKENERWEWVWVVRKDAFS